LRGVDALRCGFLDDDVSDNQGEAELRIEQVEAKPQPPPRAVDVKRRPRPVEVKLQPTRSVEDRLNEALKKRIQPASRTEQPNSFSP
jgi:hypothetical protein